MKSLAELSNLERANKLGEFAQFARLIMLSQGIPANALAYARGRASQRITEILKSPVPPGGVYGAGSWGEATDGTRLILSGFSDSLRHASAFAAAVAASLVWRIPLGEGVGVVASGGGNAAVVGPAAPTPVHRLDVSGAVVARQKSAALLALSNEFLRQSPSEAEAIISRELRAIVAAGIDSAVMTALLDGVTVRTSTGSPLDDARMLLRDVQITPGSRPFWVAGTGAAIWIATGHMGGALVAPDAGPLGGEFLKLPMYVSAGVDADTLVLIDGSRVAGGLAEVELGLSKQTTVELDDAPAGGPSGSPVSMTGLGTTSLVSAWQQDLSILRAAQWFGVARLRTGAVSAVFLGGSP